MNNIEIKYFEYFVKSNREILIVKNKRVTSNHEVAKSKVSREQILKW